MGTVVGFEDCEGEDAETLSDRSVLHTTHVC